MRRTVLAASLLLSLFVAVDAAAVRVQVMVPGNEVPAGATIPVNVRISNPGGVRVVGTLEIWMHVTRAIILHAYSNTPSMIFTRELLGNTEYMVGRASDFTLDPDDTVTVTANVSVNADAAQGASVRFTATGYLGDTSGSDQVTLRVEGSAGPKLKIAIVTPGPTWNSGPNAEFVFRVTNRGTSATTEPVLVDVNFTELDFADVLAAGEGWATAEGMSRHQIAGTIAPGASVDTPPLRAGLAGFLFRGEAIGLTARATGGGSPPAEAETTYVINETRTVDPTEIATVLRMFGRER